MDSINVKFKRVRRSKHLRISVSVDGGVLVTRPFWVSERKAREFVSAKKDWIVEQVAKLKNTKVRLLSQGSRTDYLANKEKARNLVAGRLNYFNQFYKLEYKRLSIRDQKTRWGSCSHKLGLNFNYRLVYLDPELVDYLVVHELCHLREMNHSLRFWSLVGEVLPNYKELRARLRKY